MLCRRVPDEGENDFNYCIHERLGPYSLLSLSIQSSYLDAGILLLCHGFNPNKYPISVVIHNMKVMLGTIDKTGIEFLDCYIAAGYNLKPKDERDVEEVVSGQRFVEAVSAEHRKWILESMKGLSDCRSLKDMCHQAIRFHLRRVYGQSSVIPKIEHLPLPHSLKDYLCMAQFSRTALESEEESLRETQGVTEGDELVYFYDRKRRRASHTHPYLQFWRTHLCCGRTDFRD